MIIKNALIYSAQAKSFHKADIEFGSHIKAVGRMDSAADIDAEGMYLLPGMVDIHTHGAAGGDASDGDMDGLIKISLEKARRGTTSFCPTTMTLGEGVLTRAMHTLRDFKTPAGGAAFAGVNLEGPFLSYAKRGAQAAEWLHKPDADMFLRLDEASGGMIRLVTVAPEGDGAMEFIRRVAPHCRVSLGHTAAGYDTAMAAYEAGAGHATHLFNGMPPFAHRAPGVIGAAMDAGATVELICDGLHIAPTVIRAAQRLFGDKLIIISDSLRCAGMPDGDYELGGQPIVMLNEKATLLDGSLAGSSSNVFDELVNVVRFGVRLEDAVYAASCAPAKVIGAQDIGELSPGKRADMLLVDHELRLKKIIIGGKAI